MSAPPLCAAAGQDEPLHPLSPGDVEAISDDEILDPAEPAAPPSAGSRSPPPAAASPPRLESAAAVCASPGASEASAAASAGAPTPPPPPEPDDAGLEDIMSDEEPMDVLEYPEDEDWEEALRPFNPDTFQLLPLTVGDGRGQEPSVVCSRRSHRNSQLLVLSRLV